MWPLIASRNSRVENNFCEWSAEIVSLCQRRRDVGQVGTNYQDLAVRKWARGPIMLYIFLSFSVVS